MWEEEYVMLWKGDAFATEVGSEEGKYVTVDDTLARVVYVRIMELGCGPSDSRMCCMRSLGEADIMLEETIAWSDSIDGRMRSCTSWR